MLCQHALRARCLSAGGAGLSQAPALSFSTFLCRGDSAGSAAGARAAGAHHLAASRLRQRCRKPLGNGQVGQTAGERHHLLRDLALMRHLLEFCTLFKDLLCGKLLRLL